MYSVKASTTKVKKGSTKWTYITSAPPARRAGQRSTAPTSDGTWLIRCFGDSKHFDSEGTAVHGDVR
jgi:hypothetical protein